MEKIERRAKQTHPRDCDERGSRGERSRRTKKKNGNERKRKIVLCVCVCVLFRRVAAKFPYMMDVFVYFRLVSGRVFIFDPFSLLCVEKLKKVILDGFFSGVSRKILFGGKQLEINLRELDTERNPKIKADFVLFRLRSQKNEYETF